MVVEDLDDDEVHHLSLWLATLPLRDGPVDLRTSPAWRFALRRETVEAQGLNYFPRPET